MHIHILGICGTFMGGLALIARQLGHEVTGSDANVYPPMSTQLEEQGITLMEGYKAEHLEPAPDLVVVGNAMSRGNEAVEYMLERGLPYTSGPQWLCDHALQSRWVIACAGTHGKTTTSSMSAWILEYAGYKPSFLIGGVPGNFGLSARLSDSNFFVIEADEYDSAFFDKRSKFVHYRPRTAVLNNLEFDHADIFDDLAAIQRQFHHLVRTIPQNGQVILPRDDDALKEVVDMGLWSEQADTAVEAEPQAAWSANVLSGDGSRFEVWHKGQKKGVVEWTLTGTHNVYNGLAALAAAHHVGVTVQDGIAALAEFKGVKRRMELLADIDGVKVYDDFAHHPTAIETTLQGLRKNVGSQRIIALIEPRSNTMRMGTHLKRLAPATVFADEVLWYQPLGQQWGLHEVVAASSCEAKLCQTTDQIMDHVCRIARPGDHVVIMSNGGFDGIHQKLVARLQERADKAS